MSKYFVRCGSLSLHVQKKAPENEKHAALEALRYWYSTNAMVFNAITTVSRPRHNDKRFATTSLLKELGVEWEDKDDDGDNRTYKPRLCELTAEPFLEPFPGDLSA